MRVRRARFESRGALRDCIVVRAARTQKNSKDASGRRRFNDLRASVEPARELRNACGTRAAKNARLHSRVREKFHARTSRPSQLEFFVTRTDRADKRKRAPKGAREFASNGNRSLGAELLDARG
ncbi:MAG: hypothetical protein ING29_03230, partial [Azospirillum sp.]|nr:hypothetical protein [Azospirillum sp.]